MSLLIAFSIILGIAAFELKDKREHEETYSVESKPVWFHPPRYKKNEKKPSKEVSI